MNIIHELLTKRAASHPDDLALASSKQELSFSQLLSAVDAVSQRLSRAGVQKGALVAVGLPGFENWVVTLALAKLGAVSWSFSLKANEEAPSSKIWHHLIASGPTSSSDPKTLLFDSSWLISEEDIEHIPPTEFNQEDLVRAILTSGTTGTPKLAVFNQKSLKNKVENLTGVWGGPGTEFNFMPLGATGGFSTALMSLFGGTPYLAQDVYGDELIDFLVKNQVEVLAGSPDQLSGFISRSQDHVGRLSGVKKIRLAGSHPGDGLLERLRSVFDSDISSVYGSTESGAIFSADLNGDEPLASLGRLRNGSEARVVSETGEPLPKGSEGLLETRSNSMFVGYLLDSRQMTVSAESPWFATGDQAKESEDGFVFLGRESGVLNIGGVKMDVEDLERFVHSLPGIEDALCFAAEDKSGKPILVMAIVAKADESVEYAIRLVNDNFPAQRPDLFWRTKTIDRVGLEKPARWQNKQRFDREYRNS